MKKKISKFILDFNKVTQKPTINIQIILILEP
jgi:hypothetical protein